MSNGLVMTRRQTIIWTDDGPVYWRMYSMRSMTSIHPYGSGHETVAVLLPGFAINW